MQKDMTAAGATPLILALLAQKEDYGYSLIKRVEACSDRRFQWAEGMLYPILHRLEQQGFLVSERRNAENGSRKRKYYRTTETGLVYLRELQDEWRSINNILEDVWGRTRVIHDQGNNPAT